MKTRSNRGNNGYVGFNSLSSQSSIISANKNYLINENFIWRREDWLTMPAMTAGDQKIAILYTISPGASGASGTTADGNFTSFAITGCTYVVDWGTGVTNLYSSGSVASFRYSFSSLSGNTVIEGNKQIIAQVYPETTGNTFSLIDFGRSYPISGTTLQFAFDSLTSIKVCSSSVRGFTMSQNNIISKANYGLIEFEYVGPSSLTNLTNFFRDSSTLKSVVGTEWTKNVTNFTSMFQNCFSLETIPQLDTSSGVTFSSMFSGAISLKTIPSLNFNSASTLSSMFSNCRCLNNLPPLNFGSAISVVNMFQNCHSLKDISFLGTQNVTSMQSMFMACYSLNYIPIMDTSKVTNFTNTFWQCHSLEEITGLNTSAATTVNSMFYECSSLRTAPFLNLSSCTNTAQLFSQCFSLRTVPSYNMSLVTNASSMFASCRNLREVPIMDFSKVSTYGSIFFGCNQLTSIKITGITATIDLSQCQLSSAALNEVFTNLSTTGSGKTVTITNNWGASGCNRSIATAKSWAVSG